MMDSSKVIHTIETGRIVAIIRGDYRGHESEIVNAMIDAGITAVEVTLNSPGAIESIGKLAREFGGRIAVGAGTVLTPQAVREAAGVGATFIVSPNRRVEVIRETKQAGLASFPGCFTPSEVIEALDAGADAAKLFPAVALGPGFVRALRGPIQNVRLVPTGGVTPEMATEYRKAGAWGVGIGSELVGADVLAAGGIDRLKQRAAAFVAAMKD